MKQDDEGILLQKDFQITKQTLNKTESRREREEKKKKDEKRDNVIK